MTTFADSLLFIANGVTQQSHSGDTIQISRNLTIASPTISQITVPGTGANVGQNLSIQAQAGQAQSGSNANNSGGNLLLSSGAPGTGGSGIAGSPGTVQLQAGGTTIAKVDENKFYSAKGYSKSVTPVTSNYAVLLTDDIIAVGAITAAIAIQLPASPNIGDTYKVKDTEGLSETYSIFVSGNGNNIDGQPHYTMGNNYEALELTFTNAGWSIM
jgi:hypothetical protein